MLKIVSFKISEEQDAKLDRMALSQKRSRSAVIRELIGGPEAVETGFDAPTCPACESRGEFCSAHMPT